MLKYFIRRDLAVQKEHPTLFQRSKHVIATNISWVVTSDKVGMVDQPRHIKGAVTKAKVTDGDTTGLLRVVGEVCLCILVSVVTDDLDGVLVCSDGTVRTKAPEHAGNNIFRRYVDLLFHRD